MCILILDAYPSYFFFFSTFPVWLRHAKVNGTGSNAKAGKSKPWSSSEVARWDNARVLSWLASNGFGNLSRRFGGWSGEDLLSLKEVAKDAPEFFFRKMEAEFGMTTTLELVRFKTLLNKIV